MTRDRSIIVPGARRPWSTVALLCLDGRRKRIVILGTRINLPTLTGMIILIVILRTLIILPLLTGMILLILTLRIRLIVLRILLVILLILRVTLGIYLGFTTVTNLLHRFPGHN